MRIHVRRGPSVDVASLGVNNTDTVLLRYSNSFGKLVLRKSI